MGVWPGNPWPDELAPELPARSGVVFMDGLTGLGTLRRPWWGRRSELGRGAPALRCLPYLVLLR